MKDDVLVQWQSDQLPSSTGLENDWATFSIEHRNNMFVAT